MDLILTVLIPAIQSFAKEDHDLALAMALKQMLAIGMGGAIQLAFLSPIMLLFSYTRKRSNPRLDTLIPVVADVFIILVYLQGFYQIMHVLPISGKINFQELFYLIDNAEEMLPMILMMVQ